MKKQTGIANKQYQGLDKINEFDKNNYSKNSQTKLKVKKKTDLNYDSRFNFNKYRNNKKFNGLSFTSKLDCLKKKSTKKKLERKNVMYDNDSDLCNSLLVNYEQQNSNLSDEERESKGFKHNFDDLFIDDYEYDNYFREEPGALNEELHELPPPKDDEEKYYSVPSKPLSKEDKEEKGLKILTPNKLLTRLAISLAQIKAGNNSNKLKNEVRQIVYLLYQHNNITKKVYNNSVKSL